MILRVNVAGENTLWARPKDVSRLIIQPFKSGAENFIMTEAAVSGNENVVTLPDQGVNMPHKYLRAEAGFVHGETNAFL